MPESQPSALRLGVTFHSFAGEYCSAKWSLEDLMELSTHLGGGIEIVGPSHQRGFPHLSPDFERRFRSNVERFGLTPVCYGSYADPFVRPDRSLTDDELYAYTVPQLESAARLGFSLVRLQFFAATVVERLLPHAEKFGLRMGYELHAPLTFESDQTKRLIEQIERIDNPHLGLIPDCGIFARSVPKLHVDAAHARGVAPAIINQALAMWQAKVLLNDALPKLKEMGLAERDIDVIEIFWGCAGQSDPGLLVTFARHVIHMHGKYFSIVDGDEPDVRYFDVVRALTQARYDGWLMSEYEGLGSVNSFEIVRAHQAMITRMMQQHPVRVKSDEFH
jgi:sugar phosphate isomerase/epimerase